MGCHNSRLVGYAIPVAQRPVIINQIAPPPCFAPLPLLPPPALGPIAPLGPGFY